MNPLLLLPLLLTSPIAVCTAQPLVQAMLLLLLLLLLYILAPQGKQGFHHLCWHVQHQHRLLAQSRPPSQVQQQQRWLEQQQQALAAWQQRHQQRLRLRLASRQRLRG
jgi:hypothetical protein